MVIGVSDIIAFLALILAGVDLFLIVWDRRPRLRVTWEKLYHDEWDEELKQPILIAIRMWISIVNVSPRRIWVSSVSAEWRRHRWLPCRRFRVDLPDLQRWENDHEVPTSRFWIEPWGSAVLSTDAEELEFDIKDHKEPGTLWYCIVVCDALGKWYRSKKTESLEVRQA